MSPRSPRCSLPSYKWVLAAVHCCHGVNGTYFTCSFQTQLQEASNPLLVGEMGGAVGSGAGGGEAVLKFWLEVLLSCPTWLKEGNLLYILNNLCMATFFNHKWTLIVTDKLLEAYQVTIWLTAGAALVRHWLLLVFCLFVCFV